MVDCSLTLQKNISLQQPYLGSFSFGALGPECCSQGGFHRALQHLLPVRSCVV